MNNLINLMCLVILGVLWLVGIVLAGGFWSTLAAVFVPPCAWYIGISLLSEAGWL